MIGRRVNTSRPERSLLLLKATGAVPHEGGGRTTVDSKYYAILRGWIASGRIRWQEQVREGIEEAPRAFLGLFHGDNSGKMLVRLGPDRA